MDNKITKLEWFKKSIEYKIEFEEENIESKKKAINREMERFSGTSGQWLAQYGKDIEESQKEIRKLKEQLMMLENLEEK